MYLSSAYVSSGRCICVVRRKPQSSPRIIGFDSLPHVKVVASGNEGNTVTMPIG